MVKKWLPILLILLLALALRAYQITEIPPGLTHDEANHGREAIEILDGRLRYYFPLNYGSEPLYSYLVAGSMALFGEGLFALRLVNIIFGLAAVLAMYIWSKAVFNRTTALVTAALLAVSFWPLASSRESLRAGLLPFFMICAAWFMWQIVFPKREHNKGAEDKKQTSLVQNRQTWMVAGFALSILFTLHIYLAARVAWLMFPAFLLYLALVHRATFRRSRRPILLGLLLAALFSIPMFVYLANNPQSQTRLSMLGGTLEQITSGNFIPLLLNSVEALLAFGWPGFGDSFLAYNIPGRPVLDAVSVLFFLIGVIISIRKWKQPAYAFILIWFITGIIPSLVTGSTANTTRNLAALPVVYLFPALGIVYTLQQASNRWAWARREVLTGVVLILILLIGLINSRDYFVHWAQAPAVRNAYQRTLFESLSYWQKADQLQGQTVFSTVFPGPAHDPSIALVLVGSKSQDVRWVDARYGLILPAVSPAYAFIPASTPPHTAFEDYLQPLETVSLSPNDLDPSFTLYEIFDPQLSVEDDESVANFGGAIILEEARWLTPQVLPGETAELLTRWRVNDPAKAGPKHQPTETSAAVIFTHILNSEGEIIAQKDALDAPSWTWQSGDTVLQVHTIRLTDDIQAGNYSAVVGIYDQPTGERLALLSEESSATTLSIPSIEVAKSSGSAQN